MRTWSTPEVVKLTGVTARTLRHYDAIGLLQPAATGHGGLRHYGEAELLRLQRILLLKRLDLPLATIAEILEGDIGEAEALQRHLAGLRDERDRLDRLTATVEATIRQLEGDQTMTPETWFDGLHAEHEAEARRRWGDAAVDAGDRAIRAMTPEERRRIPEVFADFHRRLAELREAGAAPDSEEAQAIVADHYTFTEHIWGTAPTAEAYKGLGALYTEDPAFTAAYNEAAATQAAYFRKGMETYADSNL
jgi:DNA-binding transcriptional MerR regulator